MKTKLVLLTLITFNSSLFSQCPVDEADLADGGTFSGNCTIEVGSVINIPGDVIWTSGTLNITGDNGSVYINSGGSVTVQSGSININDGGDGTLNVEDGGALTLESSGTINVAHQIRVYGSMDVSGALVSESSRLEVYADGSLVLESSGTINVANNIQVYGTMDISGALNSVNSRLEVYAGGVTTIHNGGGITTTRGTGDNLVEGTLNIYGSMLTYGDMEVNGGSVTVFSGADLTIGDPDPPVEDGDLLVYGGGSFMVEEGATVIVEDDIVNGDEISFDPVVYDPDQGQITINGDLFGGGDLQIFDTTPNSNLGGSGNITIQNSFSDEECPEGDFCFCGGGGDPCNSLLPVELVNFQAIGNQSKISLSWTTSSELNNDYFTLFHSNDGQSYSVHSKIQGNGTTSELHSYHVDHHSPANGFNYYKLRQTDFDGAFEDLDIIQVEYETAAKKSSLFPNPIAKGQMLNLVIDSVSSSTQIVDLSIMDVSGREIGVVTARRKFGNQFTCNVFELNLLNSDKQMVVIKQKQNSKLVGRLYLISQK